MIQNLNKQSFSPFGTILRDSLPHRGFPKGDAFVERVHYFSEDDLYFYRCNVPVYLDFELGMTVLVIRSEKSLTSFYLDKPLILNSNVEFAIIPYQHECSVRVCLPVGEQFHRVDRFLGVADLKITNRIHLGELYTLFYREVESGFFFKGESHSMYELTYVDRGRLHCVVDGNGYELHQGQLMLFTPDQWHMQYTNLEDTARFLTITFALNSELSLPFDQKVFDLSANESPLLSHILREAELNDLYSNDFIRCNLKMLLLSLLRDMGGRKKRLKTPLALRNENLIVSRALQYIAEHVYDKLSVEIVSKETGVSASHLTALFHRQMNISPGEYIRRVKLEESKGLIREGRMNFSQIAAALKYSNIHHFSRQFKDNFGVSPSEYSKSIKNE